MISGVQFLYMTLDICQHHAKRYHIRTRVIGVFGLVLKEGFTSEAGLMLSTLLLELQHGTSHGTPPQIISGSLSSA